VPCFLSSSVFLPMAAIRAAEAAAASGKWIIEIVKRNELHKFVVLPKRWIVERTFVPGSAPHD
jgi:transposase